MAGFLFTKLAEQMRSSGSLGEQIFAMIASPYFTLFTGLILVTSTIVAWHSHSHAQRPDEARRALQQRIDALRDRDPA
ncbi:hypothetical protein [Salaquimonas pukyongi]|uniref:hypothetical protein n=1 Tax=Salaquimonas pukyongi TaxID=2712698 RepID=UPI00096BAF07|nr:hypothetical protein [Salaquimonas pukyongi]